MAGYVRQSSGDIVASNTIRAAYFNAEFDALRDAFDGTNGHAHDGTAGNGPKVNLASSVSGILPVANGGTGGNTAATARTALGITAVATKTEGTGGTIDADLLDGQHGTYYTAIIDRLGYTPADIAGETYTGTHTFDAVVNLNQQVFVDHGILRVRATEGPRFDLTDTTASHTWHMAMSGDNLVFQYNTDATQDGSEVTQYTIHSDGGITVGSSDRIYRVLTDSEARSFGTVAALSHTDITMTVTGAKVGDSVIVTHPGVAGLTFYAWVSATNTVTIRACNYTGSGVASGTNTVRVTVIGFTA